MPYDVQVVDGEHDPSYQAEVVLFGNDDALMFITGNEVTQHEGYWESATVTRLPDETMASDPELERLLAEERRETDLDEQYRNSPPP